MYIPRDIYIYMYTYTYIHRYRIYTAAPVQQPTVLYLLFWLPSRLHGVACVTCIQKHTHLVAELPVKSRVGYIYTQTNTFT